MARLLFVHHSPTENLARLARATLDGANHPDIEGVEVVERAALEATSEDVVAADGYVLGTPANLGYMSGALKHFFDTTYDAAKEVGAGRPWGVWIHGSTDTAGARLAIERIVTGIGWRAAAEPLELMRREDDHTERCFELGATVAAVLMTAH